MSKASKLKIANLGTAKIFSPELEGKLLLFILDSLQISYHFNLSDICKSAYEFATIENVKVPQSWARKKRAGRCWFNNFIEKYPNLIVKVLKAIILSQTKNIDNSAIEMVFNSFERLVLEFKLKVDNIYYVNAVDVLNCGKLTNTINIHEDKSYIQGYSVTVFGTVSAMGQVLSPFLMFTPKNGTALSDITEDDVFFKYIQHFIKNSECSKARRCLLLIACNHFHTSLKCENLLKNERLLILKFPGDYPNNSRPLSSVFTLLKKRLDEGISKRRNFYSREAMTIEDISELINNIYMSVLNYNSLNKIVQVLIDYSGADVRT